MLQRVTATNYQGQSLGMTLTRPDASGIIIEKIEGISPGASDINSTIVSTLDGSIYNSARMGDREIVLTLRFVEKPDIETIRHMIYKYFPPKKRTRLYFQTTYRYLYIDGYVKNHEVDIFSQTETATITLLCPDPHFRNAGSAGLKSVDFDIVVPMFEFEFGNESLTDNLLIASELNDFAEGTIYYEGDDSTGVTLYVICKGSNPGSTISIYNEYTNTRTTIDVSKVKTYTGTAFSKGDQIVINSVKGSKSVRLLRNNVYTNLIAILDKTSTWFELGVGSNKIACITNGSYFDVTFHLEYRELYEGV